MTDWSTTPSFEQTLQKFFVCCTSFSGFKTAENTKVLATLCIMYVVHHSVLKMGEKVQYIENSWISTRNGQSNCSNGPFGAAQLEKISEKVDFSL